MNQPSTARLGFLYALMLGAILALAACANTFSKGPNSDTAKAYATISTANQQLKLLLDRDKISAAQGVTLQQDIRTATKLVDEVSALRAAGNFSTAEGKLAAAQSVITGLKTYLISQGATFDEAS